MIMENQPTFEYFSRLISWSLEKNVLDFGCNRGNLLRSSYNAINPILYTGVDVDEEALALAKSDFPQSKWIRYNRYNPVYNKHGDNSLPLLDNLYDIIIAYSVFSHTEFNDMVEILTYLYDRLMPNGQLAFTYCDVEEPKCLGWFRKKRKMAEEIPIDSIVYLVDSTVQDSGPFHPMQHFVSFYKRSFLLDKLNGFNPSWYPPSGKWNQSCIVLNKR